MYPFLLNAPFSKLKSFLLNVPLNLKNGGLNNYKKGAYNRNVRVHKYLLSANFTLCRVEVEGHHLLGCTFVVNTNISQAFLLL